MIVIGSRAAELRGVKLSRQPTDLDVIGTLDELEEFRRANAAWITSEKFLGPRRRHLLLQHPLYERVEFGADDLPSDIMLRRLCVTDKVAVLNSEAFLPTVNLLALTKRSHLNYPLNWDKHVRDYSSLMASMTPTSAEEQEYYRQCRIEVKRRYLDRLIEYEPPVIETGSSSRDLREAIFRAIAFDRHEPVGQAKRIDSRPGLIDRNRFDRLGSDEKIRFCQELFVVLGIEERLKLGRDLDGRAVYRLGMRRALRDLYAGWFQDYCLDNLATLRFVPDFDFMAGYAEAEQAGRLQPAGPIVRDLRAELARAEMLHDAGRVVEAEHGYRAILEDDSDNISALYHLGILVQRTGQLAEAERLLRRALSLEPQKWKAWINLAAVLQKMGRLAEAAANYRKGIEINPGFVPARLALGRALEQAGEMEEAIEACRDALRVAPQDTSVSDFLQRLLHGREASTRIDNP